MGDRLGNSDKDESPFASIRELFEPAPESVFDVAENSFSPFSETQEYLSSLIADPKTLSDEPVLRSIAESVRVSEELHRRVAESTERAEELNRAANRSSKAALFVAIASAVIALSSFALMLAQWAFSVSR